MEEKPKMYQNKTNKVFTNNLWEYKSYNKEENKKIKSINTSNDIRKKVNAIINSNNFIYRARVNIVINGEVTTKKIIGIYNNNIVTIDNEYIPIDKIEDIYR